MKEIVEDSALPIRGGLKSQACCSVPKSGSFYCQEQPVGCDFSDSNSKKYFWKKKGGGGGLEDARFYKKNSDLGLSQFPTDQGR